MNETQMLIGSLSNDLCRVANLVHRGSEKGATRFFIEVKRWNSQLKSKEVKPYIQKIIADIDSSDEKLTMEKAEKLLMFSILLQNYSVHNKF